MVDPVQHDPQEDGQVQSDLEDELLNQNDPEDSGLQNMDCASPRR